MENSDQLTVKLAHVVQVSAAGWQRLLASFEPYSHVARTQRAPGATVEPGTQSADGGQKALFGATVAGVRGSPLHGAMVWDGTRVHTLDGFADSGGADAAMHDLLSLAAAVRGCGGAPHVAVPLPCAAADAAVHRAPRLAKRRPLSENGAEVLPQEREALAHSAQHPFAMCSWLPGASADGAAAAQTPDCSIGENGEASSSLLLAAAQTSPLSGLPSMLLQSPGDTVRD